MDAPGRPDLRLRQRSMWSAFPLEVFDAAGQAVGLLDWPGGAGSTGQRAEASELPLDLRSRRYRITQAAVPRGWTSGRRLQLWGGTSDAVPLASVEIQVGAARRRALLQVTEPVRGEVVAAPASLRLSFGIRLADGRHGSIQEPSWLSLRRTLDVRLPHGDDALRAFLGAAVLIARTSNAGIRW